jgi:hypothetical protein
LVPTVPTLEHQDRDMRTHGCSMDSTHFGGRRLTATGRFALQIAVCGLPSSG